jgi:hypothetical protein
MLTEDYLIRRINQAIALILHAIGLRKDGQIVAAQTDIDIALELLLGMRAVLLQQMDDDSVLRLLTVRGELDLALLLEVQGRAAEAAQNNLRALHFSLRVALEKPQELPAERMARIAALLEGLKGRRLPLDTRGLLIDYDQNLLELDPQRLAAAGVPRAAVQAELERLLVEFRQG